MSKELENLTTQINASLKTIADGSLTKAQVKELAEALILKGYRLTEPAGPFIGERANGFAKRSEDICRALTFAGKDGQIRQRRQVVEPFETLEPFKYAK